MVTYACHEDRAPDSASLPQLTHVLPLSVSNKQEEKGLPGVAPTVHLGSHDPSGGPRDTHGVRVRRSHTRSKDLASVNSVLSPRDRHLATLDPYTPATARRGVGESAIPTITEEQTMTTLPPTTSRLFPAGGMNTRRVSR